MRRSSDPADATDASHEPELAGDEIQGHVLAGFGAANHIVVGLTATPAARPGDSLRRFLRAMAPSITTLRDMVDVRAERRAVARATNTKPVTSHLVSAAALSPRGITRAGLPLDPLLVDHLFLGGMALTDLGDPMSADGQPVGWTVGQDDAHTPDVLLLVASDDLPRAEQAVADLVQEAAGLSLAEIYRETGSRLPGMIEHFGFRDDISQPVARGRLSARPDDVLNPRYLRPTDPLAGEFARPGQRLVWPGEFVLGLPTQLDNDPAPGPDARPPHDWMRNGSYLVFRRLRQDVAAFRAFGRQLAAELTEQLGVDVPPSTAEAWLVGRWPDGTPLVRSPDGPDPDISENLDAVNGFAYATAQPAMDLSSGPVAAVAGDPGGVACPHFAHIRKVHPRDAPTDQGPAIRFRLMRRGIPYGPLFVEGEHEPVDRGLLFFSYQRSIASQFLTVNSTWMNSPAAPSAFGHDILVGQDERGRRATRLGAGGNPVAKLAAPGANPWVVPTGGGFFFTPAVSVLAAI